MLQYVGICDDMKQLLHLDKHTDIINQNIVDSVYYEILFNTIYINVIILCKFDLVETKLQKWN